MAKPRRVAVMIDLQWPLKHHQGVFAGVQRFARHCGDWELTLDLYAGERLAPGGRAAYDGVVARATSRLAERARRAGVPVVNVWQNSPVRGLPSVFPHMEAAGRLAASHLTARGFRQFACAGYAQDWASHAEMAAFRAALATAGMPCQSHVVPVEFSKDPATWGAFHRDLEAWVASWKCPLGVLITHDVLARYVATACRQKGISVPDDAALVGTGNELILCLQSEPALSSINFDFEEIGYRAAELLGRLMDGARPPAHPLLIPPVELVVRQSSDASAVSDAVVSRALRLIAERGHQPLRVAEVARHVHTSRRTLERRFRRALGRTISAEIARLRIERVKQQLAETNAPLKILAGRLGFQNEKRLCEAFRRLEGITPGQYRSRRRKADAQ